MNGNLNIKFVLAILFLVGAMVFLGHQSCDVGNLKQLAQVGSLSAGKTYYVDCQAGNDSNNGTSAVTAWKNVSKVSNSTFFQPGDSILFKQGCVWTGQRLSVNNSGVSGNPIVFGSYGTGGKPIIQGATAEPSGSGMQFLLLINGKQYLTIKDLIFQYGQEPVLITDSQAGNAQGITLENLIVRNSLGYAGIYLVAQSGNKTENNLIKNCEVSGISGSTNSKQIDPSSKLPQSLGRGIYLYGPNVKYNKIIGNTIHDNGDTGIGVLFGSDSTIDNNTVYNNGGSGVWVGGANGESANNLIEKNTVYGNCKKIDDLFGINLHKVGDNNIVRYNKVYGQFSDLTIGSGAITLCNTDGYDASGNCKQKYGSGGIRFDAAYNHMVKSNNKAYYNLIYNEYVGFSIINFSGIEFYNNVVSNTQKSAVGILGYNAESQSLSNNRFKNNILNSTNGNLLNLVNDNISTGDFAKNIYYPDGSGKFCWSDNPLISCKESMNLTSWKASRGANDSSSAVSPGFVSASQADFNLSASSPAIDTGLNLNLNSDFVGSNVPQGLLPDIGAYEHAPLGPVCGNNTRETGEDCDGSDLAGQTCSTKGFTGGTLTCNNCKFVTSACLACTENWTCADWLTCVGSTQDRTCNDANSCGTTINKPATSQTCTVTPPPTCTENWTTSDWTTCANSTQTRTVTDTNNCGTTVNKPATSQTCTVTLPPTCTPNWTTDAWTPTTCTTGTQTRTVTDTNNCGLETGKPATSQTCIVAPVAPTCSDSYCSGKYGSSYFCKTSSNQCCRKFNFFGRTYYNSCKAL